MNPPNDNPPLIHPNVEDLGPRRIYRLDAPKFFLTCYLAMSVVWAPCAILGSRLDGVAPSPSSPVDYSLVFKGLALIIFLITTVVAVVMYQKTSVEVNGRVLRVNRWGAAKEISWGHIGAVRTVWRILPYAAISVQNAAHPVYMPLLLENLPDFSRNIQELTEKDNALRILVHKRAY